MAASAPESNTSSRDASVQESARPLWYRRSVLVVSALAVVAAFALWFTAGRAHFGDEAAALEGRTGPPGKLARTVGEASFYGRNFAGRPTASGEVFNPKELTAAHRSLPLGTRVRVVNLHNDQSVVVRVNDRGPYAKDRIIDVSRRAAERLGMVRSGKARVRLEVLGK